MMMFQLTAARRRLAIKQNTIPSREGVSTHSRPKAAGLGKYELFGLWEAFQLTAARRRLGHFNQTAF